MPEPQRAFSTPSGEVPAPIDWAAEDARVAGEYRQEAQMRARRELSKVIPPRYESADTDNPVLIGWATALAAVDTTAGVSRGPAVLLLGPTGVGKTHAAFGALRRYLASGGDASPQVVSAPDMYAELRPRPGGNAEQMLERYSKASLLFLDDLGAAKTSEWVEEINYRLINHRYNQQLPTVVTSNVPPRELGGVLGERVASRLQEMCQFVVLKGEDRRRSA